MKFKPSFPGDTLFAASVRAGIEDMLQRPLMVRPWTWRVGLHDQLNGLRIRDGAGWHVCGFQDDTPRNRRLATAICEAVNAGSGYWCFDPREI